MEGGGGRGRGIERSNLLKRNFNEFIFPFTFTVLKASVRRVRDAIRIQLLFFSGLADFLLQNIESYSKPYRSHTRATSMLNLHVSQAFFEALNILVYRISSLYFGVLNACSI